MQKHRPLVSVCIPTHNRAKWLDKALGSLVSQDIFANSEEVEIVISDNASDDNTPDVVEKYRAQFPTKIVYLQQKSLIAPDENYARVLRTARGQYRKLHNDTLEMNPNTLDYLYEQVKKHVKEKPFLFFANGTAKKSGEMRSVDEFVKNVSFFSTWIACFGLWDTDQMFFEWFVQYRQSHLSQTHILFHKLSENPLYVVDNTPIYTVHNPEKKGGYNIAEVFGRNYLAILKPCVAKGLLSSHLYRKEKKKILLKHINPFYFDIKDQWAFDKTGYFKWLWDDYKYCPYFYTGYLKMLLYKQLARLMKKNHTH